MEDLIYRLPPDVGLPRSHPSERSLTLEKILRVRPETWHQAHFSEP